MKYLIIIFICIIGVSGCATRWDDEDAKEFINDCLVVRGTEEACLCILGCLEIEYDNYQTALINIPKSDLDKRGYMCLQQCE